MMFRAYFRFECLALELSHEQCASAADGAKNTVCRKSLHRRLSTNVPRCKKTPHKTRGFNLNVVVVVVNRYCRFSESYRTKVHQMKTATSTAKE